MDRITLQPLMKLPLPGPATSTRISVAIVDDFDVEGPETFSFEISNVVGAVIARSTGLATINENDQAAPEISLSITDVQVNEMARGSDCEIHLVRAARANSC